MSQENVEIVQGMLERFSTGDVQGWLDYWGREAEWTAVGFGAVEGGERVYRGHDGLRRFRADSIEAFAEIRVDASDFREVGDRVLVLGKLKAKGATSGAAFATPMAWLFEMRDRKIVRGHDYLDQQQALEVAGLQE
jgi:ketosteroid isomerase-like protein